MTETWLDVARDARKAASLLVTEGRYRSAVARAYYAAYSKVTYELVVIRGLKAPPDREGFSHARIRPVIETSCRKWPQTNAKDCPKWSEGCTRCGSMQITNRRVMSETPKLRRLFRS